MRRSTLARFAFITSSASSLLPSDGISSVVVECVYHLPRPEPSPPDADFNSNSQLACRAVRHQHHRQHPRRNDKVDHLLGCSFLILFPFRAEHIPHFGRRARTPHASNSRSRLCPRLIISPFTERTAIGHSLLAATQDG